MLIQLPGAQFIELMSRLTDERHMTRAYRKKHTPDPLQLVEIPANDRTKLKEVARKPCSCLDLSEQARDIAASSEKQTKRTQFYEHTRSNL